LVTKENKILLYVIRMVSINLSRSGQHVESKHAPLIGTAFLTSAGLLAFVFAVYGGLLAYNNYVDSQMTAQRTAIETAKASMVSSQAASVADFSRRSEEIESHLNKLVIPSDTLTSIEKAMLPSITLVGYHSLTNGAIELTLSASSLRDIARQMLALKTDFDSVASGKVLVDKDRVFQGNITMERKGSAVAVK
jgi:hypothetical protein